MTELTVPKKSKQQQLWDAIRTIFKAQKFTRSNLIIILGFKHHDIDGRYLNHLVKHGFLSLEQKNPYTYKLIKSAGKDAPRFTNKGELITHGSVNQNIWRAMRIHRIFTVPELVAYASTSQRKTTHETVVSYVRLLKIAGYLKVVEVMKFHKERLQLVKDTGPKPPQILRIKEVYDPNLDKIMSREVPDRED